MHTQFNPTSPEMKKKGAASLPELPWLAIFVTFDSDFVWIKEKIGLLN